MWRRYKETYNTWDDDWDETYRLLSKSHDRVCDRYGMS
jgi:hypothetical protein